MLSGGGSVPADNTPEGWADMVDRYQQAALDTRLGIPLIYGVDSVHGHGNLQGATVFPHNIGLGATRDPRLVEKIGEITAEETRASGPQWVFAPCVCVARDDRWGRTYESFGESPWLAISMETIIDGLQGKRQLDRPDQRARHRQALRGRRSDRRTTSPRPTRSPARSPRTRSTRASTRVTREEFERARAVAVRPGGRASTTSAR